MNRISLLALLLTVLSFNVFSQETLLSENFSLSTWTNNFPYSSGITRTSYGATQNCTTSDLCVYAFSNYKYLATKSLSIPTGKGISVSFVSKKNSTPDYVRVYYKIGDFADPSYSPAAYGWIQMGQVAFSGCSSSETFTASSTAVGGQTISIMIFGAYQGNYWWSVDNFTALTTAGTTPPVTCLYSNDCSGFPPAGKSSGFTRNQGTDHTCKDLDYCWWTDGIGDAYFATENISIPSNNNMTITVKSKKYSSYNTSNVKAYIRRGGYTTFNPSSPTNNNWILVGTITTDCAGYSLTVPSNMVSGQTVSVCIFPENAYSSSWWAIDDICITTASSVVTQYKITGITAGSYSGNFSSTANSTLYLCNGNSLSLSTDVPSQVIINDKTYDRKWQTSSDGSSWFTWSSFPSLTSDTYIRCCNSYNSSSSDIINTTYWLRLIHSTVTSVAAPVASPASAITTTGFTANWTNSTTVDNTGGGLAIKHILGYSLVSDMSSGVTWTDVSGLTTKAITGLQSGKTYYWRILAQTYNKNTNNGDVYCGVQAYNSNSIQSTNTISSCIAASITKQPISKNLCQGLPVQFQVETAGDNPKTYQWKFNGDNLFNDARISGVNTETLSFSYVDVIDNGSYTCYITNNCGNATSEAALLTVNPVPLATITPAGTTTFCHGASVRLDAYTGENYTYQWYKDEIAIEGAVDASYTATEQGNYSVIITHPLSCFTSSESITVNVNTMPEAIITPASATTFCKGGKVILNANTGSGLTYQWTKNNINITNATKSTYTATSAGNYAVKITNSNKCSTTSGITKVEIPTATISPSGNYAICEGKSLTIKSGVGTGYKYQWKKDGNDILDATLSSYNTNATGQYTVVVTTDICSVTSATLTLTVKPLPAALIQASGPTTVCSGNNVLLSANTGEGLTYKWRKSTSIIACATSSSYLATSSGNYSVLVYQNGCYAISNSIPVIVDIISAKITTFGSTTFCQGKYITLRANSGSGLVYQWMKDGQNIDAATKSTYIANTAGSFTVNIITTNLCSTTSPPITTTVNPLPSAVISPIGPTTFCAGESVPLVAETDNGLTYQWKKNNAVITGATTLLYIAETSASYTVSISNENLCAATSNVIKVKSNANPVFDLGADKTITAAQSVVLTPTTSFTTYQWNTGSTTKTITVKGSATGVGTHQYKLTVTNSYNCSASDIINVIVNPAKLLSENTTAEFTLAANYPNPFSKSTEISYNLPEDAAVNLYIYNSLGILVDKIINEENQKAGNHNVIFDRGILSAGIYFYNFSARSKNNNFSASKIMIIE